MKKLLIAATFALALITSAFAAPTDASLKAKKHFAGSFTNAKSVTWNIADTYTKASFTLNNERVDAFYDSYGEMLGTSKVMAFDKLPKSALETLTTQYTFPEFQLEDCIEFTNADKDKNYYISFDTKDEKVMLEITQSGVVSVLSKIKK